MSLSQQEQEFFINTISMPTKWAETFLKDPTDPTKPLQFREYQSVVTDNTRTEKMMVLRYGRRMGKCSYINDLCVLSDGTRITFGELLKRYNYGEKLSVLTMDDSLNIIASEPIIVSDNGLKPVYTLQTKSGRKVTATGNHPFLTVGGWKKLDELQPGDNILVPSELNVSSNTSIGISKIKFLAYVLSDGSIIRNVSFTNSNELLLNEFSHNLFGHSLTREELGHGCKTIYVSSNMKNNEAIDYLRSLNLYGKNSHTKFIPNEIMQLSKKDLSIFLSRLYACDGWASVSKSNRVSGNCEIGYCSVSEELAYGVGHLLTRFGIRYFITEKNVKYNGTIKKAFQICIRTKTDILKFINEIGIFSKEVACANVKQTVLTRLDKETYFDSLPTKEMLDTYNIKHPRKNNIRRQYKRTSNFKFLDCNNTEITNLINSSFYTDEIQKITYSENKQTVAVEVPKTHNYIQNDIITHNTVVLCADALWWATAWPLVEMLECGNDRQKPFRVLIFTPMDSQIKMIFDTLLALCLDSPYIQDMVHKVKRSDVSEIIFTNGSIIKGMTLGISTANKGTSARGQCLTGDTLVYMATGGHKRIDSVKLGEHVVAIDNNNRVISSPITKIFEPNIKTVYNVMLQSGKSINCSADHKLYGCNNTYDLQWKSLSDYNVGEYLSNNNSSYGHGCILPSSEVKLVAYLIGGGSCGIKTIQHGSVGFTNNNSKIIKDYTASLTNINVPYSIDRSNPNEVINIRVFGLGNKNKIFTNILRKYELYGKTAECKHIPDNIKRSANASKKLFLSRLFSTDGWCCKSRNNQFEIGYCSISKQLVLDIQSMLDGFGIHSKIQTRHKTLHHYNCKTQYVLKIRSQYMISRFLTTIGFIYGKEDSCALVLNSLNNVDFYKYKNHMIGDIHLDKIISITKLNEQITYDIEVKGSSNFIANGIVVHNSADYLLIDEVDFIPRDVLESSVLPIGNTSPHVKIRACSTPSGKREHFYEWCFTNNNTVNTINGLIPIQDIRLGDIVYGEDGYGENVTSLYKQQYRGNVRKIRSAVGEFMCTPNHEIKLLNKEFIRSEDAVVGDYICVPKENRVLSKLPELDITKYYTERENKKLEILEYSKTHSKTATALEFFKSKHMRRQVLKYDHDAITHKELWPFDNRKRTNLTKARSFLASCGDKNLYKLLGFYLAEGNILKDFSKKDYYIYSGIQLTFNEAEIEYIEECSTLIKTLFNKSPKIVTNREDHSTSIILYASWVSYVFIELCGEYSHLKKIDENLLGCEYDKWLLINFIKGDGSGDFNSKFAFTTTSEQLANQLLQLSYKYNKPVAKYISPGNGVRKDSYQCKTISRFVKYINGEYWVRISSIEDKYYNGFVYNLETHRTHTYNVSNMCTHNCTKPEKGWWSRHYASWHPSNPNWISKAQAEERGIPMHESTEYQWRSNLTEGAYLREFGAEFGEELQGVYKHTFINKSLIPYTNKPKTDDTDIFNPEFSQTPGNIYIMGVDWNTYSNGGQVVLVEYCKQPTYIKYYDHTENKEFIYDCTGKFRLFYRRGIKSTESTQRETRLEIIRCLERYQINFVYVDYGAGDTNIEELTLYGRQHPEMGISRKLHVIDAGSNIEHYDPILRQHVKKRAKSMMVNNSANFLEQGMFCLPTEEDSGHRLVDQMRTYCVKTVTARGDFTYTGEDHILDAFNLAVHGFQMQYTILLASRNDNSIRFMANPMIENAPMRQQSTDSSFYKTNNQLIEDPEKTEQRRKSTRNIIMPGWGTGRGKNSLLKAGFRRQF